jgi:lipoprotein-releasing system permease protein
MLALHLALRILRRRRTAWLALAAVTLTVTVPVLVMGVMQGWISVSTAQVRAAESDLLLTHPLGRPLPDDAALRERIAAMPGVAAVAPGIETLALLTSGRAGERGEARLSEPARVWGVDLAAENAIGRVGPSSLHPRPSLNLSAPALGPDERGTGFLTPAWRDELALAGLDTMAGLGALPLPPRDRPWPGVILGRELIYSLGGLRGPLRPGREVTLVLPDGDGGTRGKVRAEVSDTIGLGVMEVDRMAAVLPLALAQELTNQAGRHPASQGLREIDQLRVRVTPGADAEAVRQALENDTGLAVEGWEARRGHLIRTLEIQRNILVLVMVLVQSLCIFIIYAVFSTLVAELRHDLGVLLALGAQAQQLSLTFVLAGQAVCVGGGVLGWLLGWAGLAALNPLSRWSGIPLFPQEVIYTPEAPVSFTPLWPLIFIGVMAIVGFLATTLPAWRAARIDPVDTLREAG